MLFNKLLFLPLTTLYKTSPLNSFQEKVQLKNVRTESLSKPYSKLVMRKGTRKGQPEKRGAAI